MNKDEVLEVIRQTIAQKYNGNQADFAIDCGVRPPYLNDILKGRRGIGQKVLKAIGYEKVSLYRKKEVGSDL